jgi:rod shape-determining protein MreD
VSTAARSLAPWRWIGIPLLQSLGLTVLFAVPLRVFHLQLPEPVFGMWPVFAWAMIRPSMLAPFAVLFLGLFLDVFWGGPQGLWALSLLLAYGAVLAARNMMVGQSQPMMLFWFAAVTALAMAAGLLISLVKAGEAPSAVAILWQFLATILLYPLTYRLIDQFEDADVRFR